MRIRKGQYSLGWVLTCVSASFPWASGQFPGIRKARCSLLRSLRRSSLPPNQTKMEEFRTTKENWLLWERRGNVVSQKNEIQKAIEALYLSTDGINRGPTHVTPDCVGSELWVITYLKCASCHVCSCPFPSQSWNSSLTSWNHIFRVLQQEEPCTTQLVGILKASQEG